MPPGPDYRSIFTMSAPLTDLCSEATAPVNLGEIARDQGGLRLLVDANELILDSMEKESSASYAHLDRVVTDLVRKLKDKNITAIFVLRLYSRGALNEELVYVKQKFNFLCELLEQQGEAVEVSILSSTCLPVLARNQLVATLNGIGEDLIRVCCESEFLQLVQASTAYAVLSSNIAFSFRQDVRLIPFNKFGIGDGLVSRVYTRDTISYYLGVEVNRLPELAALYNCRAWGSEHWMQRLLGVDSLEPSVRELASYLHSVEPALPIIHHPPIKELLASNQSFRTEFTKHLLSGVISCSDFKYEHAACTDTHVDFELLLSESHKSRIPGWILSTLNDHEYLSPYLWKLWSPEPNNLDFFTQPVRRLIYATISNQAILVKEGELSIESYPHQDLLRVFGGRYDLRSFRSKELYHRVNDLHNLINVLGSEDAEFSLSEDDELDADPLHMLSDTIFMPCGFEAPYKAVGFLFRLMTILSISAYDSGLEVALEVQDIRALANTVYILNTEIDVSSLPAIEPSSESKSLASHFLATCQALKDLAALLDLTSVLPEPRRLFAEHLFYHLHAQSESSASLLKDYDSELCALEVEELLCAALAPCGRLATLSRSAAAEGADIGGDPDPFESLAVEPDYDALLECGEPSPIGAAAAGAAGPQSQPPMRPQRQQRCDEPALPIAEHRETILRSIAASRVTCIQGETGCGKSSMVPQFIVDDAAARGAHAKVIVTQPRRIAAVTLASRVAEQRGEAVGGAVGYRIGHGDHVDCDATSITFVTIGYLLQYLCHNPALIRRYTHLVLDEVRPSEPFQALIQLRCSERI